MNKSLLRRLRVFSVLVVLVTISLIARLAWLQVYNHEHYAARAENNRQRQLPISAPRGEIFDANGELLAANRAGFAVSILDINLREAADTIHYLSELLDIEETVIRTKITEQRYRSFAPIRIANNVSQEVVAKLEERRLDLPGVIIEEQPMREYVNDNLAAHVLGYMNAIKDQQELDGLKAQGMTYRLSDAIGRAGVEATWEETLRGQDGMLLVEINRYGRRTRVLTREEPVSGNSIHLTLDARLQQIAEQALQDQIELLQEQGNTQAGKGSVVIINPNSGAILAMVSYPDFNPNTVSQDIAMLNADPNKPQLNRAIRGGYPVGSSFKMVPGIAALEEGIINERSTVTCSGQKWYFDRNRKCLGVHGTLSIVPALARSCNIFFYEMGFRLGTDRLTAYAEDFGFGATTQLRDLNGEISGVLNSRKYKTEYYTGNIIDAAIGQGHAITPLQMANFAAMLANRGTQYRPYLVQQATDHNGNIIYEAEPDVLNQLEYNPVNWDIIQRGMEMVTDGGTASSMRQLPVKVAGKTGTVTANGYPHTAFVGYAPAENPELAFFVIVENSQQPRTGSSSVPIINQIIREYYTPEPDPDPDPEVEVEIEL
jgi:penicillin-binding protein 2